jgi:hypothetical protein
MVTGHQDVHFTSADVTYQLLQGAANAAVQLYVAKPAVHAALLLAGNACSSTKFKSVMAQKACCTPSLRK